MGLPDPPQGDLFAWAAATPAAAGPVTQTVTQAVTQAVAPARAAFAAERLDEGALLAALGRALDPGVALERRSALLREAGRRRLAAAVPELLRIVRLMSGVDAARPAAEARAAVAALAAIGDTQAIAELARLILAGSYGPATWQAALDGFLALELDPPEALLARALEAGPAGLAATAARLAGQHRHHRLAPALRRHLDALAPALRRAAAIGLGSLGDTSVKKLLEERLRQEAVPDGDLVAALGEIGDRDTLILLRRRLAETSPQAAAALLGAAARIGGPLARGLLAEVAASGPPALRASAEALLAELAEE